LKVHLEQIYNEEVRQPSALNDLAFDEIYCKILGVEPNQQKNIVGKVVKSQGEICIDGEIYFTLDAVKGNRVLPLDTLVQCKAVASTQGVRNRTPFQWRAIEICRSNFMEYTSDPHKLVCN
jgi:hypothetical protein